MDPETQKYLIGQVFTEPCKLFELHKQAYLVHKEWWDSWREYVGFDCAPWGPKPSAINNQQLLTEDSFISDIQDSAVFLNKSNWQSLQEWYTGGPELPVFIFEGAPDLRPLAVYTCMNEGYIDTQDTTWTLHWVSQRLLVSGLKSHLSEFYFIPPHKAVVHIVEDSKSDASGLRSLAKYENETLAAVGFTSGVRVSIEQQNSYARNIDLTGELGNYHWDEPQDASKEESGPWDLVAPARTDTQELRGKLASHLPLAKLRPRISPIVRTYKAYNELMAAHFSPG